VPGAHSHSPSPQSLARSWSAVRQAGKGTPLAVRQRADHVSNEHAFQSNLFTGDLNRSVACWIGPLWKGTVREIGVVPDFVFGLKAHDGSIRSFMVGIDRGTMPVIRADKLRAEDARL
jgi:hypothetical protein